MSDYQFYHNDENEFLWKLLADPVNNTHLYTYNLQRLVNDNPQSGIFRALLARTGGEDNFKLASVHFNSKSLYKLINYPSGFERVSRDKIIIDAGIPPRPVEIKPVYGYTNNSINEPYVNQVSGQNDLVDMPVTRQENFVPQPETAVDNEAIVEPQIQAGIVNNRPVETPKDAINESKKLMDVSMEFEYDLTTGSNATGAAVFGSDVSIEQLKAELKSLKAGVAKQPAVTNEVATVNKDNGLVLYEEAAPYSFMWWLNKTRKEKADSFQPYAKPRPKVNDKQANSKVNVDELQHQYMENIFHLTAVEDLDKHTAGIPETWDFNRKESKIIERFLEKDPQIKPQQADKLDNENKAKRSSEDSDEIVTETLAAIYAEQMLYQKSINAYKKLMLKFPEKSIYFADKIEQLEKKTNL